MFSVLLPSRERPASLRRALSSLAHGDVEIIVGLDNDDPTALEAEKIVGEYRLARVVKGPRQPTLAHVFNTLQAQAQAEWFVPFPDDYTIDQADWADKLAYACARLPDGLGVAYLWDRLYPWFSTFPVVSRRSVKMQGFYMPTFFPFLYGDTWWNEVGVMSGLIQPAKCSVTVCGETGGKHKFRDLRVWSRMFDKTRPLREELALNMIASSMGDTEGGRYLAGTLQDRSRACQELQAPSQTNEWCELWDKESDDYVNPHYSDLLSRAERFLELMNGNQAEPAVA